MGVTVLLVCPLFASREGEEASALVERARQASDIRREGDPAFRLKATFKITKNDGSAVEGTYTEFWNSPAEWRTEIALGDFRRTILVIGPKIWTLDDGSSPPEWIHNLTALLEPLKLDVAASKPLKIQDTHVLGVASRCFSTATRERFCFEKTSGLLIERTSSLIMADTDGDWSCFYRDYRRFGERDMATLYQCGYKHTQIEATFVDLTFRPEIDSALFIPPANAKESSRCLSKALPPIVIRQPEPVPPRKGDQTVAMSTIIGLDGRPHDIKVIRSVDKDYDRAAVEALRQWEFTPASCGGEPREVKIAVEMVFHYH
jgi:TonB family protein